MSSAYGTTEVLGCAILQGYIESFQNAPGGDIATHDPPADDMNLPWVKVTLYSQTLESILKQEYPNQILCAVPGQ